jgi:hypothetical protein
MATLQESFKYEGDATVLPFKTVRINFEFPVFQFDTILRDGKPFIERNQSGSQTISIFQDLARNSYSATIPDQLLIGPSESSVLNFWKYLSQLGFTDIAPGTLDFLTASYTVQTGNESGNLFSAFGMDGLYSIASSSDEYPKIIEGFRVLSGRILPNEEEAKKLEQQLINYIRENIFLINENAFNETAMQFRTIVPNLNNHAFLYIVSHLTDLSTGKPVYKIATDAFIVFLKAQFNLDKPEIAKAIIKLVKDNFSRLIDFPVAVPEIIVIDIKGTFKISTSDNSAVALSDFNFYDLSIDYSIDIPQSGEEPVAFKFDWTQVAASDLNANTVPFVFNPVVANFIGGPIYVRVKGYDGSLLWEKELAASNPDLAKLEIVVPKLKPLVISTDDEHPASGGNKRLHGKVVEISGDCE